MSSQLEGNLPNDKEDSYSDEKGRVEETREVQSLAADSYESPEEKALIRKIDMRILPIACLMYLFACNPAVF